MFSFCFVSVSYVLYNSRVVPVNGFFMSDDNVLSNDLECSEYVSVIIVLKKSAKTHQLLFKRQERFKNPQILHNFNKGIQRFPRENMKMVGALRIVNDSISFFIIKIYLKLCV